LIRLLSGPAWISGPTTALGPAAQYQKNDCAGSASAIAGDDAMRASEYVPPLTWRVEPGVSTLTAVAKCPERPYFGPRMRVVPKKRVNGSLLAEPSEEAT